MGAATAAQAQEACAHRGDLDAQFCDANRDLVADTPTDPKRLKDPSTLVFAFTPVEDPAVYENIFKPFTDYLARTRIEKVKNLLLNPHKRISEAAYETGFQSLSQFNRVFRRVTGQSPTVWRAHLAQTG